MLKPIPDLVTMTAGQLLILDAMSEEISYSFSTLSLLVGVPAKDVRHIVRGFHAMGLADFGWLYDEDSDALRGRGYWLTGAGWKFREHAWRMCRYQIVSSESERLAA